MTFRALVLDQTDDTQSATVQTLDDDALPDGDVTVDVEWSSLNYKDGMVLGGVGRLVRTFPHVPGVDLAGTVVTSDSDRFAPGDRVVCTGFHVGEALVGWLRAAGAGEVGVAGRGARLAHDAPDHGDRHRGPDRDALRGRARA